MHVCKRGQTAAQMKDCTRAPAHGCYVVSTWLSRRDLGACLNVEKFKQGDKEKHRKEVEKWMKGYRINQGDVRQY